MGRRTIKSGAPFLYVFRFHVFLIRLYLGFKKKLALLSALYYIDTRFQYRICGFIGDITVEITVCKELSFHVVIHIYTDVLKTVIKIIDGGCMGQTGKCVLEQECRRRQIEVRAQELRKTRNSRIPWMSVASDYPDPRECIAAFLVFGSAEVLSGVKPANLVRISNRTFACGRNMYALWHEYGADLMHETHLEATPLVDGDSSMLLLLYDPVLLQRRLRSRSAATFLRSLGYPAKGKLDTTISHLASRFVGADLPHEIGVFLGYPLKDVAAFMGLTPLRFSSQRLWKIYGRARRSEALADLYQEHHTRVAKQLRKCKGVSFNLWRGEKLCA